jgi:hypothetical protein
MKTMTCKNVKPRSVKRLLLALREVAFDVAWLPRRIYLEMNRRSSDIYPAGGRKLNPPGPSPWYLRRMKIAMEGDILAWSQYVDPMLAGISRLYTRRGKSFVLLDFNCYVQPFVGSKLLIWCARDRGNYDDGLSPVVQFDIIDLSRLKPIVNPPAEAERMRQAKQHYFVVGEPLAEFAFPTICQPGKVCLKDVPSAFKEIDETLVLASYSLDIPSRASLAIYIFDFRNEQVEIIPQDWFNNGDYDFGYQWVTRIARDPTTGRILGECIRLRPFQLAASGKEVEQWLERSPFRPATE